MTSTNAAWRSGSWLAVSRNPEAKVRLFCLPHAGGGAAHFHAWKRLLPATIEVSPVQIPGREGRLSEPSFTDAEALIEEIAPAVGAHLDKPYAIFGHSMGAMLAFELAQRLRELGHPDPAYLFVSGRNATHLPIKHGGVHKLPDQEFLDALAARYGGMPKEILETPEFLEVYLPILRADLTLIENHIHKQRAPLACPIAAFAGEADRNVSKEGLAAWEEQTSGGFESRLFEGDHFYLNGVSRAPLLELLAERLTKASPRQYNASAMLGPMADNK